MGNPRIPHAVKQLHREGKQLTGWEKCQCRKARIQHNHVGCALLVWVRLKEIVIALRAPAKLIADNSNVYQLKNGLLKDYLTEILYQYRKT